MTSKACWYCGGLPKLWWWLATLIGLPLLFFFMISDRQGPVEDDLTDRVRTKLISQEANWAEVTLDQRGRDVMLSGAAPDEASRDTAIQTAQNVYGVRAVEHDIEIQPLRSPELSVQANAGKVILKGLLPTQDSIDSTVAAAGKAFGTNNIDNQLGVGERLRESGWITKVSTFLPALTGWKTATFDINDDGSKLTGIARTDEAKGELLQQAKQLIGGTLEESIDVKPLQAATFGAQMAKGKLILSGLLPSQANADNLINAAGGKVGAANVVNQITVSDDAAEASWLSQAQGLLGSMNSADASANIADNQLTLAGTVNSYQAHINALGSANAAIAGSGLTLRDNISVNIPKQPEAQYAVFIPPPPKVSSDVAGSIADGKLTLTGTLVNQQAVDMVVYAAETRIGADNVVNQLQIDAERNPAQWLDSARKLLLSLTAMKGAMAMNDDSATFSGTTESNEDYLGAIRKARWSMQNQPMAFENNVELDTSRLDELARLAREKAELEEQERLAREKAEREEQERLAREKAELEEQERLAREKAELEEQERLAREKAEREEQERLAREKAEREEQERLAREKAEREEQERLAREKAEREEQERLAREAARLSGQVAGTISDGKLTLAGTLQNQQEVDSIVSAANARVGADNVINRLTIDAERKPAPWLSNASQLLTNLPEMKGSMVINDDKAMFRGTVETNNDYIAAIRQARTAMQGQQMAFENNVALDTSRLDELARLAREKAEREEQERLAREKAEREEQEKLAREKAEREEQERLAREKAEREEQERLAREKAEREEQERLAREKAEREEQERLAREKAEREEQERLVREKAEREEQERLAREKAEREEREKLAREKAEREEQERLAREKAEREEQERLAREKAEREEQERLAREKAEREEQERLAREKAEREEQERLAREKAEREEQEKLAREKAEREKAERAKQEKLARRQACQTSLNEAMTEQTILFETNKAEIKTVSYDLLFELASILTACEDTLDGQIVAIGGHTDSRGSAAYNQNLSQRRANAILAYLQNAGLATNLLEAKGFGEEKPVADNDTEEGRSQNRRITFEIRGN